MNVASILPQSYLHLTEEDSYHMCLAHLISAPGFELYTKHFRNMAADPNKFIIMDNGLIETGSVMSMETLVRRAMVVNADEIVLPDAFRDKEATLALIEESVDFIDQYNYWDSFSFMAIPQGATLEEWLECAITILNTYEGKISTLGIPKVLVDIAGRDGRLEALAELAEIFPDIALTHSFHLLGCWTTPIEVMTIEKASTQGMIPPIRGVDSVLPYNYARAGMRFSDGDRPDAEPIDFMGGKLTKKCELVLGLNLLAWRDAGDMNPSKSVIFI